MVLTSVVFAACSAEGNPPGENSEDNLQALDGPTVEIVTGNGYSIVTTTYLTGPDARVIAGPVGDPQELLELEYGIEPWGPVVATHAVSINGESYTINRLASPDPFTATYQLEDGTIRVANGPVQLVADPDWHSSAPATAAWVNPEQEVEMIYEGWVLAWFTKQATEQEISTFIAAHNLEVVMSWFEPPETATDPDTGLPLGNEIAWFQFEYDPAEFATIDAALAYFNGHALVEYAMPDLVHGWKGDYAPPNDPYYEDDTYKPGGAIDQVKFRNGFATALGVDGNPDVEYGPMGDSSGGFSNQVVAVIDDGVLRNHPDLGGL